MGPVIDVELPDLPGAEPVTRGFAACLASVTEVPVGELPLAGTLASALGRGGPGWPSAASGSCRSPTPPASSGPAGGSPPSRSPTGGTGTVREVAVLAFGTPPGVVLSPQEPALLGRATATCRSSRPTPSRRSTP